MLRIASLVMLFLALAAVPAQAQWFYDNGPINGRTEAWQINDGSVVSDTFVAGNYGTFFSFSFGVWEPPRVCALCGMSSVQWSITSDPDGGTVFASGTASGVYLSDTFLYADYWSGYEVHLIRVSDQNMYFTSGEQYWLNLWNAVVPGGGFVLWDENGGAGCGGNGGGKNCPSLAYENFVGPIPSEAFTLEGCACGCWTEQRDCPFGSAGTTPEPASIALLGSGVLGLAGVLRRKLLL